jgi:hypothetical protein
MVAMIAVYIRPVSLFLLLLFSKTKTYFTQELGSLSRLRSLRRTQRRVPFKLRSDSVRHHGDDDGGGGGGGGVDKGANEGFYTFMRRQTPSLSMGIHIDKTDIPRIKTWLER